MSDLRDLYQEVIIDHNRNPRNFAKLDNSTHEAEGFNPLCGDKLKLYLIIKNNIIEKINFEGSGCAISTASASLMTEHLLGKTVEEAEKIFKLFHDFMITDISTVSTDLGKLKVLAGVREYPARVKCATLAWHTLEAALHQQKIPVSTE
ncbi:MAG TPA: SUF system NifU family Fe-S cluster assembly protein [Gammaproteobacteria bacterium]|nr:SUF system NifU family Fe-S cluster assembly protein [Gammaproteobacteria bacterium]